MVYCWKLSELLQSQIHTVQSHIEHLPVKNNWCPMRLESTGSDWGWNPWWQKGDQPVIVSRTFWGMGHNDWMTHDETWCVHDVYMMKYDEIWWTMMKHEPHNREKEPKNCASKSSNIGGIPVTWTMSPTKRRSLFAEKNAMIVVPEFRFQDSKHLWKKT